jgi:2-polyprenyl-3-methyl-5-hydroxy-6-metoxy-1,4-benzoquinol methylase
MLIAQQEDIDSRSASGFHQRSYGGLPDFVSEGLHARSFEIFRRHVRPGAKVLDLGSGPGAWPQRLHDASYDVVACDLEVPLHAFPFPYYRLDLQQNFGEGFAHADFDAVSLIEVIEHVENPRHVIRQIRPLLKKEGILLLTTPNASGLYSRVRFFFTGQMSMFTDEVYVGSGHITPLTAWQLEKIFAENDMPVLERRFHDAPFMPPRSAGDVAKIGAWLLLRVFMSGTVGGQHILYVLKNGTEAVSPLTGGEQRRTAQTRAG